MPLTIWRMTDGKAGHDSQSRGLCKALSDQTDAKIFDVDIKKSRPSLLQALSGRFPAAKDLPDPALIIGAGHRTHWPMLAAKRARGGKTIVLMKPSLPVSFFDYCLVPEHDSCPAANNVIPTSGALNEIMPTTDKDEDSVLIMVGGPSRHFDWNNEQVAIQIKGLCQAYTGKNITITGSPRTPAALYELIKPCTSNTVRCFNNKQLPRKQLLPLLARAAHIWVSEDSVSMIFEALTAGAKVGLIELPAKKTGRIARAVTSLIDQQKVTPYSSWKKTGLLYPATQLNEARRCAKRLIELGASL